MSDLSGKFARLCFDRPVALVTWTIVVGTAIRLAMAWAEIDVSVSEAYYTASARHFELSYFDHPPLSFWITHATMALTGSDWLPVVRAPFIAMFVGSTVLVYRLGAELFDDAAGAFAAVLFNLSPLFAISIGAWVQPDGPLIFCLLAATLCIARLAFAPAVRHSTALWIAAGFWFGLALLSKYYALLWPVGILAYALTSREHRRWFSEPGPYLAAAVALALFTPVLMWNWQHDWISFSFQGARTVEHDGIQFRGFLTNILGTAVLVGPWIWWPQVQACAIELWRGPREPRAWFFAITGATIIVIFSLMALWVSVDGRFHWQAPGFALLFPLLGLYAAQERVSRKVTIARWLFASAAVMVLFVALAGTHAATGWIRTLVPATARLGDPTLKGLTFNAIRPALASRGWLDKPRLFVVSAVRNDAGKLDLALGGFLPVVCFCQDPRSLAFSWAASDFIGWDALIIDLEVYGEHSDKKFEQYFRKIEFVTDLAIKRGDQVVEKFRLYYATGYSKPFPMPMRDIR